MSFLGCLLDIANVIIFGVEYAYTNPNPIVYAVERLTSKILLWILSLSWCLPHCLPHCLLVPVSLLAVYENSGYSVFPPAELMLVDVSTFAVLTKRVH